MGICCDMKCFDDKTNYFSILILFEEPHHGRLIGIKSIIHLALNFISITHTIFTTNQEYNALPNL